MTSRTNTCARPSKRDRSCRPGRSARIDFDVRKNRGCPSQPRASSPANTVRSGDHACFASGATEMFCFRIRVDFACAKIEGRRSASPRLNQSITAKPINHRQAGERIMFLLPSGRTTGCGKLHRGGADSRRKALAGQFLEPFLCLTKCTSIIGIKIVPGISGIWSITICVATARTPAFLATSHRIKQTSCRISGMFILAQTVSPQAQDDCGMGKQPGCPGAIRSHRFSGCKGPFEIEGAAGRESRMLRLKSRPGH